MEEDHKYSTLLEVSKIDSLRSLKRLIFKERHAEPDELYGGIFQKSTLMAYLISSEEDLSQLKLLCTRAGESTTTIYFTLQKTLDFTILSEIGVTQGLDIKLGTILKRKWEIKLSIPVDEIWIECVSGEFQSSIFPGKCTKDSLYKVGISLNTQGPARWSESYWRVRTREAYFGPILWLCINLVT